MPGIQCASGSHAPVGSADRASSCRLELLGPLRLHVRGRAVEALPRKAQVLLAYLALHAGRAFDREHLADLLWTHSTAAQARRSLRDCLLAMRKALGDDEDAVLQAGPEQLGIAASVQVDAHAFDAGRRSDDLALLQATEALYRDELLAGIACEAEPVSQWLQVERRRLAGLHCDLLLRLAGALVRAQDTEAAIACIEKLVRLDPLREDAHRLLMHLYADAGRRYAALRQYEACAQALRRELGATPEAATMRLADSLRCSMSRPEPDGPAWAYALYLRTLPLFRASHADNQRAIELLREAIALDPLYAPAYGMAARCYQFRRLFGWVTATDPCLQEGVRLARRGAELGSNDADVLWKAGIALAQLAGEVEHGLALIERSLALNPNSASAWISGSFVLSALGDGDAALEHFERAQRLDPLDAIDDVQWVAAAFAHFAAGRLGEAQRAVDRSLSARPSYTPALRHKLVLAGLLHRPGEAALALARLQQANPEISVAWLRTFWQAPLRRNPQLLQRTLEGARQAGLREGP